MTAEVFSPQAVRVDQPVSRARRRRFRPKSNDTSTPMTKPAAEVTSRMTTIGVSARSHRNLASTLPVFCNATVAIKTARTRVRTSLAVPTVRLLSRPFRHALPADDRQGIPEFRHPGKGCIPSSHRFGSALQAHRPTVSTTSILGSSSLTDHPSRLRRPRMEASPAPSTIRRRARSPVRA